MAEFNLEVKRQRKIMEHFTEPHTIPSLQNKLAQLDPPYVLGEATLRRSINSLMDQGVLTLTGSIVNRKYEYAPTAFVGATVPKLYNATLGHYIGFDEFITATLAQMENKQLSGVQLSVRELPMVLAELLHIGNWINSNPDDDMTVRIKDEIVRLQKAKSNIQSYVGMIDQVLNSKAYKTGEALAIMARSMKSEDIEQWYRIVNNID